MKRTDPTVSLLERGADGKPARAYVSAAHTDIRKRTGWPDGLLQDDSRALSRWLASQPGARRQAWEAALSLEERDFQRRMQDVIATQPFRSDE